MSRAGRLEKAIARWLKMRGATGVSLDVVQPQAFHRADTLAPLTSRHWIVNGGYEVRILDVDESLAVKVTVGPIPYMQLRRLAVRLAQVCEHRRATLVRLASVVKDRSHAEAYGCSR